MSHQPSRGPADVVRSGELDRLSATSRILSDDDLRRDIHAGLAVLGVGRMVATADLAPHVGVAAGLNGAVVTALARALARGDRQFPRGSLDEHLGRSSVAHLPRRLADFGDGANNAALRAAS